MTGPDWHDRDDNDNNEHIHHKQDAYCLRFVINLRLIMTTLAFLIVLLLPFVWLVDAAELVEKSIEHDGLTRWFLEYKPDNYQTDPALVVLVHGGTQSMRELFDNRSKGSSKWLDVSDANGFLLLAPNGVNVETGDTFGDKQNWSDMRVLDNPENTLPINDDLGFIEQLIQYAIATHNINPSKVYTTGSSNGGIMTYTLLLKKPQLFAAGAAFIANLPTVTIVKPDKTVPIMIMNGNKDRLMKWDGGDLRSDVGGNVRSALATRDWWIQNNLASTTNVTESTLPNRNLLDRCRIRGEFYPPHVDDAATTSNATALTPAPVHFYTMDGGGHSMPIQRGFFNLRQNLYDLLLSGPSCHDVDGAVVAWEFLSSYTL